MSFSPGTSSSWIRSQSGDPAVVLGEALARHLSGPRLQRLLHTLPGGEVLLKRHPRAGRNPGRALQAVWMEGLASQFRARAAAISPALLEALDQAGWKVPESDPFGDTSESLVPPTFSLTVHPVARLARQHLTDDGGPPVVVIGPRGGGCSAVAALILEDPRIQQAFPGGVHVSHGIGTGGLLDVLRDVGTQMNHPPLGRASDLEQALVQFRTLFQQSRTLIVLDDVQDYRSIQRLWGGLGAPHKVLITSEHALPGEIPAVRLRVPLPDPTQAGDLLRLWEGGTPDPSNCLLLVQGLGRRPDPVIRSARLLAGPHAWLTTTDLLGAISSVAEPSSPAELNEAIIEAGLRHAPPILTDTMLAIGTLPPGPAILPDDLLCSVVGPERWNTVRHRMGETGLIECVGTGRWRIPPIVSRVIRRHSAQVPQLTSSARRAAMRWARRRLRDCAADWTPDGRFSLRLRELRAERPVILGIIGRDPLNTMDPEDIPFGLVAWLLPHGQVRDLIARSSKQEGHSWRGSAWRWLADDLLGSGRIKDAARLLSAVAEDSRRTGKSSEHIEATIRLARVQHERGNLTDARELLETAASEAERTQDIDQEAEACLQLGALLDIIGKPDEAVHAFWRAVALFRDDGQHAKAAEATGCLGMLARRAGQLDVAEERFRMQAALADAAQDRLGVAVAEGRLGRLALEAGNPTKAVYWLDRAADAWDQDHHDPTGFLELLTVQAEALMAAGKLDLALATARRRIEEAAKSSARTEEAAAVTELSRMLTATGARPEALRLLSDALQRDRALHDTRSEAQHLLAAGEAHGARRTSTHAVVCFEAARVVAEDAGWREGVARALEGIATAESSLGQLGAALCDARGALAIYQRLGQPLPIARWKVLFGGVLIAAGSQREGRQLMSEGAQALASLGWSQAQVTALIDGGTTISRRA